MVSKIAESIRTAVRMPSGSYAVQIVSIRQRYGFGNSVSYYSIFL